MTRETEGASIESTQRLLRYRWGVYGVQLACVSLVTFQFVVPATIGEQLSDLWGLNATALGLLGSVLFYTYGLLQIPAGYLSDKWGPRRTISLAMLVTGIGQLVFTIAPSFEVAIAGRALTGLGGGLVLIALLKTLVIWFRAQEFATLVGGVNFVAFGGAMLATAPLAYFSVQWGWRVPLAVVGGVSLLLSAVNWAVVRDDPRELGMPSLSAIDPHSSEADEETDTPSFGEALQAWLHTPSWVVSVVVWLGYGGFLAFQSLWAGPYLIQVHDRSTIVAGTSLFLLSVGAGLGPFVAGFLSDKVIQARKLILIMGAVGVLGIWVWILATTAGASALAINVTYLLLSFFAGFLLIGQTMIKEYVRPEMFGMVFGIYNMILVFVNAFFQILMGWLLTTSSRGVANGGLTYSSADYRFAFILPLSVSVVGLVLVFLVPESLRMATVESEQVL